MRKSMIACFLMMLLPTLVLAAPAEGIPKALWGTWKLIGLDCKDHKLGALGLSEKKMIESHRGEENYVISKNQVEHRLLDPAPLKKTDPYCEMSFVGKWNVHDSTIVKPTLTFQRREGKNGFKCYGDYKPTADVAESDWTYAIEGDLLKIEHKNLVIKTARNGATKQTCETGANFVLIYQTQK